jgi:hypothetical protein
MENGSLENKITKYMNNADNSYTLIAVVIIVSILFLLLSWIFYTLSLKDSACSKLDRLYNSSNIYKFNGIFTSNSNTNIDSNFSYNPNSNLLKNHYILTAYNCCCGDGYKNNFVNICALEKCISFGVRCLDFEIYSYNSHPIIASSTANDNNIKETYNYINFRDVLNVIKNQAFNEDYTSCNNDPLFLHFRIMSTNSVIYNEMGTMINTIIGENSNSNLVLNINRYTPELLVNKELKMFKNKIIIMVNTKSPRTLENSSLNNYVNLKTGSDVKLFRYNQVVAAGENNNILINDSKESMIMVLPDINNSIINYPIKIPYSNGIQFLGMKMQNFDSNLLFLFQKFKSNSNFPYMLKPPNLRQDTDEPQTIEPGVSLTNDLYYGWVYITNSTSNPLKYELKFPNTDRFITRRKIELPADGKIDSFMIDKEFKSNRFDLYLYDSSGDYFTDSSLKISGTGLYEDRDPSYNSTNNKWNINSAQPPTSNIRLTIENK